MMPRMLRGGIVKESSDPQADKNLREIVKKSSTGLGYSWTVFESTRPVPPFPVANG